MDLEMISFLPLWRKRATPDWVRVHHQSTNRSASSLFFLSRPAGPAVISQQQHPIRYPLTTENSVQSTEPLLQTSITPVYPNSYDQNFGFKDSMEEDSTDGGFRQQPILRNPNFYRFPAQEDVASGSDV